MIRDLRNGRGPTSLPGLLGADDRDESTSTLAPARSPRRSSSRSRHSAAPCLWRGSCNRRAFRSSPFAARRRAVRSTVSLSPPDSREPPGMSPRACSPSSPEDSPGPRSTTRFP
jgi:hypothetical protein